MIKPCGSGTSTFGCPAQLESLHGCPCLSLIASSTARSGHRGCSVAQLLHCSLYICKEIFRSPSLSLSISLSFSLFLSQCAITSLELCQPHRVGNSQQRVEPRRSAYVSRAIHNSLSWFRIGAAQLSSAAQWLFCKFENFTSFCLLLCFSLELCVYFAAYLSIRSNRSGSISLVSAERSPRLQLQLQLHLSLLLQRCPGLSLLFV